MLDGTTADRPMMRLVGHTLQHTQRDGYAMVRLPYGQSDRFGMEIMLPHPESDLAKLLAVLDARE